MSKEDSYPRIYVADLDDGRGEEDQTSHLMDVQVKRGKCTSNAQREARKRVAAKRFLRVNMVRLGYWPPCEDYGKFIINAPTSGLVLLTKLVRDAIRFRKLRCGVIHLAEQFSIVAEETC